MNFAAGQLAAGFLLVHAMWLAAFLTGALAWWYLPAREPGNEPPPALSRLALQSATGLALLGFYAMAAGFIGLLSWQMLAALPLAAAVGGLATRTGFGAREFWVEASATLRGSISFAVAGAWLLALFVSIPCILPDTSNDANTFHLVYPYEWWTHHRITAETWLREPYYAMNWLLLYAWMFACGLFDYTSVLTALATVLSAVAVQALVMPYAARLGGAGLRALLPQAALFASALPFLFNPVVIRWGTTGLIDVPIGFFALATVLGSTALLRDPKSLRLLASTVVCGSFLVGMKTSLFLLFPLAIALVIIPLAYGKASRRTLLAAAACLTILSSPWYLRSFVLDGDPLAPTLNLKLHGVDGVWSKADLAGQLLDIGGRRDLVSIARLPYDVTVHTETDRFREYGVPFIYLLMYVPVVFLLAYDMSGAFIPKRDRVLLLSALSLSYLVAYWVGTTYLARYSLLFAALLAAFTACLAYAAAGKWPVLAVPAIGAILLLSIPSPGSYKWLRGTLDGFYFGINTNYRSREAFLTKFTDGWVEEECLARAEQRFGSTHRVYGIFMDRQRFMLARHGITLLGDWFGPERYSDMVLAVHEGRFAEFAQRFEIDGLFFEVQPGFISAPVYRHLIDQARADGFKKLDCGGSGHYEAYVRTSKPAALR